MIETSDTELYALLIAMQKQGTSVSLRWSKQEGFWRCGWVKDGLRYVALSTSPILAAREAHYKGRRALSGTVEAEGENNG